MESRSLLERISARIGEARPGTRKPLGVLSPDDGGDDSPRLPPCSQQLNFSNSEEEKSSHRKREVRAADSSKKNKHFSFPDEKPRSAVQISDSSDEDFENFLIQLKTPKQPAKKTADQQSSLKSFIVGSEDEDEDDDDDFDSMFSRGRKGPESGRSSVKPLGPPSSLKAAGSSQWTDSPVFISDSDEDSIVIRSTWADRHKPNPKTQAKGQRAKSVPAKDVQQPPNTKTSGGPERPNRPEPSLRSPVSSDDEFESLMDRLKNRTKTQTPGSTARKGAPKTALTEPTKAPCVDLTNKKVETKRRPPSHPEVSNSPYFIPDKTVKTPLDDVKTNTGVQCKVAECFLGELSRPSCLYVKDFKQKRQELSGRLYSLYNRTIFEEKLPSNLEILWNKKMRKTAGYCVTGQKKVPTVQRYARIELSEKVCDSADRLRDTLIHEVCHAATWLINGVRDGHGQYWRFYARKATLIHPELPMVTRCHTYEINYKFTYECLRCKNTIGRHSKSLDTERFICALCHGKLVLQQSTRKDGSPANTQLTPFAKFVKENYGSAKKEMSGMSHGEIMRQLSADFSKKTKISD